jgi:FKBP-type peptidyl-prolyl cis-trans isomerase
VLRGIEESVISMKKGEKANVTIKSIYGYGETGNKQLNVGPNEDLKLEIELHEFERVTYN